MTAGRPTDYNEDISAIICAKLAEGESLRSICRQDGMPALATVFKWLAAHKEFVDQYAKARDAQADALADEILEIADNATNDWMEKYGKDGECIGYQVNGEAIGRSRLRVDTRKWIASKILPKKYGEKIEQTHKGDALAPIVISPTAGKW